MARREVFAGNWKMYKKSGEALDLVKAEQPGALLSRFTLNFVLGEWADVVDAWQLASWDDYRDVKRLGRKTRLSEAQRQALWQVFEGVQSRLEAARLMTQAASQGTSALSIQSDHDSLGTLGVSVAAGQRSSRSNLMTEPCGSAPLFSSLACSA